MSTARATASTFALHPGASATPPPLRAVTPPETEAVRPATIHALDADPRRVHVQFRTASASEPVPDSSQLAHLAVAGSSYTPAAGDRVLVAGTADALYVIGVLDAPRASASAPALALPDGATITVAGAAAELRDPAGNLLVRYEAGAVHLSSPTGDLVLAAPAGRVLVQATDIDLHATHDVTQRAGHALAVESPRIGVKTDEAHVTAGQASVVAERIMTTAGALVQQVERFDLTATRLVERTRDTYRDAADLYQASAGRMRSLVKGAYALYARRAAIASEEETKIDGSKVLLG